MNALVTIIVLAPLVVSELVKVDNQNRAFARHARAAELLDKAKYLVRR